MAKTLDLGPAPKQPKKQPAQPPKTSNTTKAEAGALVDLNFKVSAELKREFKLWAASHDMTQKAVFELAFENLKKTHL